MAVRKTRVIHGLTTSAVKAEIYAVDPYFRDGWEALRAALASAARVRAFVWRYVPLLVRPDAIAAGRGRCLLDRLHECGLEPVGHNRVTFDRRLVREIWRYQLNVATRDRIRMMDRLLIDRPGLLILLRATRLAGRPACVELRTVKGPSRPERRATTQLRRMLSDATASVITLVHTPDEPIDVIRDLAVLLDEQEICRLVASAREATSQYGAVLAELVALQSMVGAHSLGFETAVGRLNGAVAGSGLEATRPRARANGDTGTSWDQLVVAAHLAQTHFPGGDPVVPDTEVKAWDGESR